MLGTTTTLIEETSDSEPVVTLMKVPEEERLNFYYKHFANDYLCALFERYVFSFADHFSEDYSGGCWDFYELSNGGMFIALPPEQTFKVVNAMNYSEALLNGIDFGIFCSSMTLTIGPKYDPVGTFSTLYYHLRDYYCSLPDERLMPLLRLLD